MKKIIELNAIYDPKFVYVDRGFGEYQIEMLHLHGRENPETGLDKKVKGIQFSQKIEIRDPGNRTVDPKDAKDFMINQTAILLDRDKIVLSPFDDMVWKQMMDYQVVRISQSGKPQYTSENEHALDAFMLTILGFTIEFPNITKILEEIKVARKALPINQDQVQESLQKKVFGGHRDVYKPLNDKPEKEAKDNPNWHWNKVSVGYGKNKSSVNVWGTRGSSKSTGFSRAKF